MSSIAARILTTRWAVRLPIPLFRAGLGLVFGGRLLMLEHRGRVSGQWRQVVLEVADRESRLAIVIASGFGEKAQWYRNLRADRRCIVRVGVRRHRAVAELLDESESGALLAGYAAAHPLVWRRLDAAIVEATGEEHPRIPMVRLHLQKGRGIAR